MIRVAKQPEPTSPGFDFDGQVRQPGLSALAELTGKPQTLRRRGRKIKQRAARLEDLSSDDLRDYPYWTRALEALHESYGGICAYACFYIEPLCGPTVDHFVAIISTKLQDAYEWGNYRLACSLMNARKREFPDVLDPFLVEDGWFVLNLGTFKVEPAPGLPTETATRVQATIDRLGLTSREYRNMCRRYFDDYWNPPDPRRPIPLWFLEREAPFLARELRRQNRIRPEDTTPDGEASRPTG
ncbi:hypothetical protein [Myxococcus sp. AB025B]|uniref:hypothetical protein n=1 Tax=Myxococcus TaxID=32 RepID=UPI001E4A9B38|nr:hypothetical protein [Myxococcus sp. AB025B]